MLVMVKPDMFAHKLMAMYERIGKTSRDIYDVYFLMIKIGKLTKLLWKNGQECL